MGAFVLAILLSGFYFAARSGSDPAVYGNDFSVYYHAAREVISGRDPYQKSLGDWTPYIYPPLLAELISPLALLPLPIAAYLWFLISAFSVVAAALMSARLATGDSEGVEPTEASVRAIAACSVVLVIRFVLDTFDLGQVNGVVAALAVAHVYLYARDRRVLSALAIALAVSIKLTPAVLLLYHIAKGRLKFVAASVSLVAAITVVSFAAFGTRGVDAFQVFWARTLRNEQGYNFAYSGNQSLRGVIERLSGDVHEYVDEGQSRDPFELPTLLISLALLALSVRTANRSRSDLASAAPFFCCMVLLSPLSWKAHYVILIAPIAHLLFLSTAAATKARRWILSMLVVSFVLFNFTGTRVIGLAAAEWADVHSLVVVGGLIIYVFATISQTALGRSWLRLH